MKGGGGITTSDAFCCPVPAVLVADVDSVVVDGGTNDDIGKVGNGR